MFAISTEEIQALFDKELAKANEHNSPFHSAHEGYSVLLEEEKRITIELIKEAIQVGAMCDKFLNYLDTKKEGKQNV